jgi:hypothetical protein
MIPNVLVTEHIGCYQPIREQVARLSGRQLMPDPRIEALESGERVELPAWLIVAAIPEMPLSAHPDDPQYFIVEPDGLSIAQEVG